MKEDKIKCPICGTKNDIGADSCKLCKTHLSKKEDGSLKVKSPKTKGKTITIVDIEDPLTRKKLEELTLIPGVSRKKALLLYESGIHSIEEFLQKAFHGEKLSINYSRTVANKLLIRSLKKGSSKIEIPCPSCNAANPANSEKCHVCNFDIKKDMESISLPDLSGKLSSSVKELLTSLNESDDFEALPEELKSQFAAAIESDDIDFDMEKPEELDSMGINLDEVEEAVKETELPPPEVPAEAEMPEIVESAEEKPMADAEEQQNVTELTLKTEDDDKDTPKKEIVPVKETKSSDKQEKIRKVLTDKMVQWRKAGYDVGGLEGYLEDVEGFKIKAKEVLSQGKVVKGKYQKQLEMWREKGFDVSELEPLLETDIDAFMDLAKDILKKQKKK